MKTSITKKSVLGKTFFNKRKNTLLCVFSVFAWCFSVQAQNITGVVKNASGTPIANALVSNATNVNSYTKTATNGTFTIAGNTATKLTVAAFKYETKRNITVTATSNFQIVLSTDSYLTNANNVYHLNFDHFRPGNSYSESELKKDLPVGNGAGFAGSTTASPTDPENRVSVDPTISVGGKGSSLKVRFPKNKLKTSASGIDVRVPLGESYKNNTFQATDLYVSYWIKFSDNFDFTKCGGKLPSLGGEYPDNDRWKGRIMWRKGGSIQFYPELKGSEDSFASDSDRFWGSQTQTGNSLCIRQFTSYLNDNQWHNIELHYKFETPGQNDGYFEGWVDGGVGYKKTTSDKFGYWRPQTGSSDININYLLLSTFLGGSSVEYEHNQDVFAWLDEFKVSRNRINDFNGGNNNTPTNNPPVVNFTSPASSLTAPASLVVKVTATDSDASDTISNVKLYINNVLVSQDGTFPYEWNTANNVASLTNLAAGTYTLKAVATDSRGATAEKTQTVTVSSSTNACTGVGNPTVNISSPANNATFNQATNVTISATATSTVNIIKVEFYDGTTLVGTDTSSPYSFSSSTLSVGTHNFTAKAYSDCNKSTISGARTIVINTVVTPPPTGGPISGLSCGNAMQALTFELSAQQRVNATSYNWFFRGAKESLTTASNGYSATVIPTRGDGEICVGVRYSTGTSYVQYCKTITNCAARTTQENSSLTIYPNPSKDGLFSIELKTKADVSIIITDILGHQIFDFTFKNENETFRKDLDLSKVEKGIYFLNVSYEGKIESSRLIIE